MSRIYQPTLEECRRYDTRWGDRTSAGDRVLPPIAGGADWALSGGAVWDTWGAVESTATGTTVNGGASNTKGSPVQLVASTTRDCTGLWVGILGGGNLQLVDILVGAAGSEVVLIPNIVVAGYPFTMLRFPVGVPAGSRISARLQAAVSASSARVIVYGVAYAFPDASPYGRVTAYGASISPTSVTIVQASTTPGAWGAWAEINPSTANPMNFLVWAGFTYGDGFAATGLVQLAIGASGSEQVIAADVPIYTSTNDYQQIPLPSFPVSLPAGTRLSARAMESTNASLSLNTAIYGIE